jgi:hypothetical protein
MKETGMALQNQLSKLEQRHQALKREIQDELSHPGADDLKLAELKRRKLQLKDEIERLKRFDQPSIH